MSEPGQGAGHAVGCIGDSVVGIRRQAYLVLGRLRALVEDSWVRLHQKRSDQTFASIIKGNHRFLYKIIRTVKVALGAVKVDVGAVI